MSGPVAELRALTGVRGIAAWGVVLYHLRLSLDWLPAGVVAVLGKGYLAVDFFFMLSGFVIWLSWHERLRSGGAATIGEFLRRRFARIWPLHAVILGGTLALVIVLALTGRDTSDYPLRELPLHLLLVQNWGFTGELSWNHPAWSISTEFAAYLLFPLLAMATDWRRWSTPALVALLIAILLALHLVFAANGHVMLGADITRLGLLRCLAEFGVGTITCALWLRRPPVLPIALVGVALLLGAAVGGAETLMVPGAMAALLLTLALTAGRTNNPFEGRLIHYLGEISYATYLSHFMLWVVFKLAFVRDANAVSPLLTAGYLVAVLVASVLLYHAVERPAQRVINGWRRVPQQAPATR